MVYIVKQTIMLHFALNWLMMFHYNIWYLYTGIMDLFIAARFDLSYIASPSCDFGVMVSDASSAA